MSVERDEDSRQIAQIQKLYSEHEYRFRFRANQPLQDALETLRKPESKMAGKAIYLFSQPQRILENHINPEQSINSEILASGLERKLQHLKSRAYPLAKHIDVLRNEENGKVGFALNVLLDNPTLEQLHSSVGDGLNQTLFGRRALEAVFWLHPADVRIVDEFGNKTGPALFNVLQGGDETEAPSQFHSADDSRARAGDISWVNTTGIL